MRVGPGSSAAVAVAAAAAAAAVNVNAGTSNGEHENEHNAADNEKAQPARLNESAQKYMQELMSERSRMENQFPLAVKLIDEGMKSIQAFAICTH